MDLSSMSMVPSKILDEDWIRPYTKIVNHLLFEKAYMTMIKILEKLNLSASHETKDILQAVLEEHQDPSMVQTYKENRTYTKGMLAFLCACHMAIGSDHKDTTEIESNHLDLEQETSILSDTLETVSLKETEFLETSHLDKSHSLQQLPTIEDVIAKIENSIEPNEQDRTLIIQHIYENVVAKKPDKVSSVVKEYIEKMEDKVFDEKYMKIVHKSYKDIRTKWKIISYCGNIRAEFKIQVKEQKEKEELQKYLEVEEQATHEFWATEEMIEMKIDSNGYVESWTVKGNTALIDPRHQKKEDKR